MQTKVGAVALTKLVSFAGPSLASIPNLPKYLLFHYLRFWEQLEQCKLRCPGMAEDNNTSGGGGCHPIKEGEAPSLHAGSLRLFLGSLCQILGDAPPTAAEATGLLNGVGRGEVMTTEEENGMSGGEGGGGGGVEEAREVLRMLVEAKLSRLKYVLDTRRVPGERESGQRFFFFKAFPPSFGSAEFARELESIFLFGVVFFS